MLEAQEMRAIYCDTLVRLAETDSRIVVLDADLAGPCGTRPFQKRFPKRYINVGIAEANMIGVAAGLATTGKVPVAHSFGTFSSRRCFDQVAISVCYAGLNVKIAGTDPGLSAEANGGTHMALEDAGLMRLLPGMRIFEPVDGFQLRAALPVIMADNGPVYMRLLRKKAESVFEPVFGEGYTFRLGKADTLREGTDMTILASGLTVSHALDAANQLAAEGLFVRVLNIHTLPLDEEAVLRAARETGAMVTVENHSVIGGLGSATAELLAEHHPTPLERLGVRDRFGEVGDRAYLLQTFGLTANHIAAACRKTFARKAN